MTHRVNVNFSDQAYQTLENLSASLGKSMSEVLREAITLMVWYEAERAKGNKILIESPSGTYREIVSV